MRSARCPRVDPGWIGRQTGDPAAGPIREARRVARHVLLRAGRGRCRRNWSGMRAQLDRIGVGRLVPQQRLSGQAMAHVDARGAHRREEIHEIRHDQPRRRHQAMAPVVDPRREDHPMQDAPREKDEVGEEQIHDIGLPEQDIVELAPARPGSQDQFEQHQIGEHEVSEDDGGARDDALAVAHQEILGAPASLPSVRRGALEHDSDQPARALAIGGAQLRREEFPRRQRKRALDVDRLDGRLVSISMV